MGKSLVFFSVVRRHLLSSFRHCASSRAGSGTGQRSGRPFSPFSTCALCQTNPAWATQRRERDRNSYWLRGRRRASNDVLQPNEWNAAREPGRDLRSFARFGSNRTAGRPLNCSENQDRMRCTRKWVRFFRSASEGPKRYCFELRVCYTQSVFVRIVINRALLRPPFLLRHFTLVMVQSSLTETINLQRIN